MKLVVKKNKLATFLSLDQVKQTFVVVEMKAKLTYQMRQITTCSM